MREDRIDVLRGWAVILVVFGHCIEYASGHEFFLTHSAYNNCVFKIIYSFHMPLFACISGWLFYSTVQRRTSSEIIKRRFCSLVIPIISWVTLWMLLEVFIGNFNMITWIKQYCRMILTNFWFLWAIFVCSLLVLLIHKVFSDSVWIYFISIFLMMLIPDSEQMSGGAGTKFLYSFFVVSYLIHFHGVDIIAIIKKYKAFFLVSFIVSNALYDYNTYIYISGYDIYGDLDWYYYLGYDLQRFFTGCVGSVLMLLVVWNIYKKNLFNRLIAIIGRESIGIYILSSKIISGLCYALFTDEKVNYIYDIILTVVIIGICHVAIYVMKKCHLINKIFLGGL